MKFNILPLCVLILSSCTFNSMSGRHDAKVYPKKSNYNYAHPDTSFKLNSALTEISGLTYYTQANTLLAVNDEKGSYFELDINSGKIIGQQKFHSSGDYEGIEVVGGDVFVVKSNGKLYRISDNHTQSIETPLSTKNDVEGLGYDESNHQLLLACKEKPIEDKYPKGTKAIYSFNIGSEYFNSKPYLLTKRKAIIKFLNQQGASKKIQDRSKAFSPSGVAVHPQTQNIYVLSARGSMMLVYNAEHKLIQSVFFDRSKLKQPEGICFGPKGNLFISTEGQETKARIFVYHAKY